MPAYAWDWQTDPAFAWSGEGAGYASSPGKAEQGLQASLHEALGRWTDARLQFVRREMGGHYFVIVDRKGKVIGRALIERMTPREAAVLAGAWSGPGEANPRARKNFFWGKKEAKAAAPEAPRLSFEEGLRRAQALGKGAPLGPDQYYLVKMPAPGGRPGTVWYFLSGLRPRAFERASSFVTPQSYITSLDPWKAVLSNLQAHRTPGEYSALLLDTLENKVGGVYDYARVAATVKAKENPYWVEVGEDGSPRQEQIWTGPGRSYWGDRQFSTADDHAVGEIIEMVEPFGVRSQYEVVEAASGKLSKQRGKVRRKYRTQKNPQARKNPRQKKSIRELAVSTLTRRARKGDAAARRELGRRGLGLTGKKDYSLCGYCGSPEPLISGEDVWRGYTGWPCCPDCGGV